MKVINFSDDIRNIINKIFYPLDLQSLNDSELYNELFKQKIDILEQNESLYKKIIATAFLDQYKIYTHYIMVNDISEEEMELIEFYDENIYSLDDVINYVEEDYMSLIDMIQSSLLFYTLKRNEQREILIDSKRKDDYLKNISSIHLLDKMYYSFPYSLNDFIENYEEQLKTQENGFNAKEESILDFTDTIKMLFISDPDNFLSLIDQLIENYKMTLIDSKNINKEDKEILEILKLPIVDLVNILYYNDLYIQILLEKYLLFQKEYPKEKQEEIKKEYSLKKEKRF